MSSPDLPSTAATSSATPPRSRIRHWILGIVLLALASGGRLVLGRVRPRRRRSATRFFGPRDANRRTPIHAVPVRRETIDVQIRALGTVTPLNTVTVRARLDGALDRVLFTEGQRVTAGQLLAQIDPRPYEVALAQAQGQMKENEARLKNAEGDLARYTKLVGRGPDHRAAGDDAGSAGPAVSRRAPGQRGAGQQREAAAVLHADSSRPSTAASASGRSTRATWCTPTTPTASSLITQMRPISVLFTVPEAELPAVLDGLRKDRRMPVEAWDRNDTTQDHHRRAADGGQPDRHHHRHDQAAGAVRQRRRTAVPEPVRQHPAARPPHSATRR